MATLSSHMVDRLTNSKVLRSEILKDMGGKVSGASGAVKAAAKAGGYVVEHYNKGQSGEVAFKLRKPGAGEEIGATFEL